MIDLKPASAIRVWDDATVGQRYDLGTFEISPGDIDAHARAFGEPALARVCRLMRMLCDGYLCNAVGLGAGGVEDVSWPAAVTDATTAHCEVTCVAARPLNSRPGVGLATFRCEARSPDGDLIVGWTAHQFLALASHADQPATPIPDAGPAPPAETLALPGHITVLGTVAFPADAVVAFAQRFDPQRFHVDADAARHTLFGALCASGWHTCSVWAGLRRAHLDAAHARAVHLGLPRPDIPEITGFTSLAWKRPAYAGDVVTFALEPADTGCTGLAYNAAGAEIFRVSAVTTA